MVKAKFKIVDGRDGVLLALSHANLDRLRADGLNGFIKVAGEQIGLPIDIWITAGETEAAITHELVSLIGPLTNVSIAKGLKS